MTGRRGIPIGVGAAVAVLVVALIVVVAGAESPPSASEALARAKRFIDQAESVEYRVDLRFEYSEEGGVDRTTLDVAAAFPDRFRSILSDEGFVSEDLIVGEDTYARYAETRGALESEQWTVSEEGLPPPEDLDLILNARRARVVGRADGHTTLELELAGNSGSSTLVVTMRNDGRPTKLRFGENYEEEVLTMTIVFDRWNGDVMIEAPAATDIDPTPFIEEEDVAAFDDAPLYQPRALPVGWELDSASVLTDFTLEEEGDGCDTVSLSFFDEEDPEGFGYLSLYMAPTSCAPDRPGGAEDFVAGTYQGWIEEGEGYSDGVLIVGDTVVQFDGGLTVDELAVILGDLVPLDFANPPAATIPLS